MCDGTDLAGALSADIHGPFVFVLVHNAVVDANSTSAVNFFSQLQALLSLWEEREGGEGGCSGWRMENLHSAKVPIQMESLTDTTIKTFLDSNEAAQKQPAAKHFCVFTWASLRIWPLVAITTTSGYALGMH